MHGRTALITGVSGGLGKTVTQTFLDAGATVCGVDRHFEPDAFTGDFTQIPADLTQVTGAEEAVRAATAALGRIDCLVHLVGGFDMAPVHEAPADALQKMLDLNLTPAFHMMRLVLPAMRQQGSGRIVCIGSRAVEGAAAGMSAYAASKAALVSLVRAVAAENATHNITANVLLPHTIDTPANRKSMPKADTSTWIPPAALAQQILWLCGESGAQVTGAAIPVYGRGY